MDLTGQKFGRLTVLSRMLKKSAAGKPYYLCECDCGKKVAVLANNLKQGGVQSCGCLRKDQRAGKVLSPAAQRKQAERDFLAEQRRKAQEQS